MKLSKNSVSIAGEFAVLSQLALRGYDANLTLGNTKSVDILASEPETGRMFRLEVKTRYNNKPSKSKLFGNGFTWVMGEKHETINNPNLFYCFVNIEKDANTFTFFIVPSHVVAKYVRESHQFWLDQTDGKDSSVRQFRLGIAKEDYLIDTPLAKKYENKWSFDVS
jgi:hypothetical protein